MGRMMRLTFNVIYIVVLAASILAFCFLWGRAGRYFWASSFGDVFADLAGIMIGTFLSIVMILLALEDPRWVRGTVGVLAGLILGAIVGGLIEEVMSNPRPFGGVGASRNDVAVSAGASVAGILWGTFAAMVFGRHQQDGEANA